VSYGEMFWYKVSFSERLNSELCPTVKCFDAKCPLVKDFLTIGRFFLSDVLIWNIWTISELCPNKLSFYERFFAILSFDEIFSYSMQERKFTSVVMETSRQQYSPILDWQSLNQYVLDLVLLYISPVLSSAHPIN